MSRTLQRLALTAVSLAAAAAVLTACAGNAGTAEPVDPVGTWGDAGTRTEPSLQLAEDGKLTGTDGCNRLVGSWSDDGETIAFDDVASTRMACPDVDAWLSGLATGTISGETLTVLDASGAEIGTLERTSDSAPTPDDDAAPIDPAAFIGTWGTETTDTAPGEPFIVIAEDGTASGSDGCNSFGGMNWTVNGDSIEFTDGYQTLMACEGVDQWLNQRATATVEGDTMTFFDESGAEIGTLPRTA